MRNQIEIFVGDVNDVEARVYARYVGAGERGVAEDQRIILRGTLRGPYCEGSRTLPAEIAFCDTGKPGEIQALIPDPCTWSPELPHLYHVHVEARDAERILSEYLGMIGLCRNRAP